MMSRIIRKIKSSLLFEFTLSNIIFQKSPVANENFISKFTLPIILTSFQFHNIPETTYEVCVDKKYFLDITYSTCFAHTIVHLSHQFSKVSLHIAWRQCLSPMDVESSNPKLPYRKQVNKKFPKSMIACFE